MNADIEDGENTKWGNHETDKIMLKLRHQGFFRAFITFEKS